MKKLRKAGLSNGFGAVRLNPILQMSLKGLNKGEENASKYQIHYFFLDMELGEKSPQDAAQLEMLSPKVVNEV